MKEVDVFPGTFLIHHGNASMLGGYIDIAAIQEQHEPLMLC